MPHRILSVSVLALGAVSLGACDSANDGAQSAQLSRTPQAPAKNAEPAMTNPKAIIIAWIGPSDRPTPPTVLWSDKAARDTAAAWIAKKGSAPIGVTDVETAADALVCASKAAAAGKGSSFYLEVTAWDGAAPIASSRLDADASKAFLSAAVTCVGPASPTAGYLKSLLTMVTNASK